MGCRWLAVTWSGGGNVGPLIALAAGLSSRGHQVCALATSSIRSRLADAGLGPVEPSAGWLPNAEELLGAVERFQPDAVLVDYMLTGALCGASASALPTVVLVHTLYRALLVDGAPAPIGMAGGVDQLNEVRSGLGLPRVNGFGELLAQADLVLVGAPEALDSAGPSPENLIYAGPLVEPPPSAPHRGPPPGLDPLVVVSLGTAMSGGVERETLLLRKIIDALSALPVRAVVNLPDYLAEVSFAPPPHVAVTGYMPHAHLLSGADLLVTHAGLGSVSIALSLGVPMVCLPLDRDQPVNAEAVERIGAGLRLPADCTVEELMSALSEGLRWRTRVKIEPDPALALDAMEAVLRRP